LVSKYKLKGEDFMAEQVYSVSICGRAILDLHSLNNEGGEGNQITTRMVNIIGEDNRLHQVNAISGDMFKHIQAEHLQRIAKQNSLALCRGCQEFNANRILADTSFIESFKKATPDREVIDMLLKHCSQDDMEGILITAQNKALGRKSTVEFGWVAGVPELVTTDSYFHVKYVADSGSLRDKEKEGKEKDASNLGQNIFHRPASSGVYAVVVNLEAARIGYNDISQTYPISQQERTIRYQALLESLLYTFLQPNGAMRNTQHPHLVNFEGAVVISHKPVPAPTVSPINKNYRDQIQSISTTLNGLREDAIEVKPFESLAGFAEELSLLSRKTQPLSLTRS